jgi:hypothetical protein
MLTHPYVYLVLYICIYTYMHMLVYKYMHTFNYVVIFTYLSTRRLLWRCTNCKICESCGGGSEEEGNSLLYCECCDRAYHMTCVSPIVETVPLGQWYCQACVCCDPCKLEADATVGEAMVIEDMDESTPLQKETDNDRNVSNNDHNYNQINTPLDHNDRKTRNKGGKSALVKNMKNLKWGEDFKITETRIDSPRWGTSLNQCIQCESKFTKIKNAVALETAKKDFLEIKDMKKSSDIIDIKNETLNIIESEKCRRCDEYGDDHDLILCLGCSFKYHLECSGVTYIPRMYTPSSSGDEDYRCQSCLDKMVLTNEFHSHLGSDVQALDIISKVAQIQRSRVAQRAAVKESLLNKYDLHLYNDWEKQRFVLKSIIRWATIRAIWLETGNIQPIIAQIVGGSTRVRNANGMEILRENMSIQRWMWLKARRFLALWRRRPRLNDIAVILVSDTNILKPDMSTSKPDTNILKPDMSTSKPDTNILKPDMSTSKSDTNILKPDTNVLNNIKTNQLLSNTKVVNTNSTDNDNYNNLIKDRDISHDIKVETMSNSTTHSDDNNHDNDSENRTVKNNDNYQNIDATVSCGNNDRHGNDDINNNNNNNSNDNNNAHDVPVIGNKSGISGAICNKPVEVFNSSTVTVITEVTQKNDERIKNKSIETNDDVIFKNESKIDKIIQPLSSVPPPPDPLPIKTEPIDIPTDGPKPDDGIVIRSPIGTIPIGSNIPDIGVKIPAVTSILVGGNPVILPKNSTTLYTNVVGLNSWVEPNIAAIKRAALDEKNRRG